MTGTDHQDIFFLALGLLTRLCLEVLCGPSFASQPKANERTCKGQQIQCLGCQVTCTKQAQGHHANQPADRHCGWTGSVQVDRNVS